jgi:hypothetical protein
MDKGLNSKHTAQEFADDEFEHDVSEQHQIKVLLFNEWYQRVVEDGMFDEENESESSEEEEEFKRGNTEEISIQANKNQLAKPSRNLSNNLPESKSMSVKIDRQKTVEEKCEKWIIN